MTPLPRHVVIAALLTLAARDVCAQSTRAEEMAQARRDQEARDAVEKLEGTIDQVSSLVASRRLTAADAAPLQDLLNRVIQSLLDDQVTVSRSTSVATHLPRG